MSVAGAILGEIPDELKSRKLVLILITMMVLLLLCCLGASLAYFLDADMSLFTTAMGYVATAGTAGAVAQAVPDSIQAKQNTYRATPEPTYSPGILNPPDPTTPAMVIVTDVPVPEIVIGEKPTPPHFGP